LGVYPEKIERVIGWLNLNDEEKRAIRELSKEIVEKMDEILPRVGKPQELYDAARHLIGRGKLLRGLLVMLINRVYGHRNKERALKLATAIELLHTASLIHDDIIDGAKMRRGVEAVHKKFGVNTAIVATDLLISIAYNISSELGERVIKAVSDAGRRMSEGEVLEGILEEPGLNDYLKVIDGKSAALIEAACLGAAVISGAPEDEIRAFASYGKHIGYALQIGDDILDYVGTEDLTGKTNPILSCFKRANIVEILMNDHKIPLKKAIFKAYEIGEKMAKRAIDELSWLDPEKREIFEEFTRIILKRPF